MAWSYYKLEQLWLQGRTFESYIIMSSRIIPKLLWHEGNLVQCTCRKFSNFANTLLVSCFYWTRSFFKKGSRNDVAYYLSKCYDPWSYYTMIALNHTFKSPTKINLYYIFPQSRQNFISKIFPDSQNFTLLYVARKAHGLY